MEIRQIYKRILPGLDRIAITDTHEHLLPEQEYLKKEADFFNLFFQHYASSDLIAAGMDFDTLEYLRWSEDSPEQKWEKFAPHWQNMENTSFARVLKIAVRDLYDIHEITKETIAELCARIKTRYKPGWYHHVLREKSGIKKVYVRSTTSEIKFYQDYFYPIVSGDLFLEIKSMLDIAHLEEDMNITIHSLNDLIDVIEKYYTETKREGAIGIKITQAYRRTLKFEKRTFCEAESIFNKIFGGTESIPYWNQNSGLSTEERKPLVDYLVHHIVRLAGELGLIVQIHTGFQEGQGNYITNSNPSLLTNLFLEYRKTRYDVLHCGFPYYLELACMAKNFPNVYPNMTWIYSIGNSIARQILCDWLELIPINKIIGFGGDYHFVEGVYGHARLARQAMAQVLSEKVAEGVYSEQQAFDYGRRLLTENAEILYPDLN